MIKCLVNGLDVNYPCSPTCELFGDCTTLFETQKKASVRTNADRIRAMTDEELVLFLDGLTNNCAVCNENCGSNEECPIYKEGHYCRPRDIMDWLRQPVKED